MVLSAFPSLVKKLQSMTDQKTASKPIAEASTRLSTELESGAKTPVRSTAVPKSATPSVLSVRQAIYHFVSGIG